jgi:hypothetical protein
MTARPRRFGPVSQTWWAGRPLKDEELMAERHVLKAIAADPENTARRKVPEPITRTIAAPRYPAQRLGRDPTGSAVETVKKCQMKQVDAVIDGDTEEAVLDTTASP